MKIHLIENMNYKKGAELIERAESVYKLISSYPNITQAMLMTELNLSRKKVEKAIEILRKQGRIQRVGSDRKGSWIVK